MALPGWHTHDHDSLEGDLATVQGKLAETTSATTELAGEVDAEQARILAVMEQLDPLYDEVPSNDVSHKDLVS